MLVCLLLPPDTEDRFGPGPRPYESGETSRGVLASQR